MNLEVFNAVVIFVLGLVFGSFYNVVGYRLANNMSIVFPASHCTKCNHKLRFYELIPVISYLFLKGRCKVCKERISPFYPFFELLTGVLFLLSYLKFGLTLDFLIAITFISVLIIISISDVKYFIIPDEVLITGVILIIIELVIKTFVNDLTIFNGVIMPVLNGLGAFALLFLFKCLGDLMFKTESLGGGDIKLLFLISFIYIPHLFMMMTAVTTFTTISITIFFMFFPRINFIFCYIIGSCI